MPQAAPRPCAVCRVLVKDGSGRCGKHKVRAGTFADSRRGTRHERGYGADWDKKRLVILARDAGLCCACTRLNLVTPGNIVDHVVPKSQGGDDDDDNLQTICGEHNAEKTAIEARRGKPAWPLVPNR